MSIIDNIKDILGLNMKKLLRNLEEDFSEMANNIARRTSIYIRRELTSMFLILFSIILFSLAAVFFLIEYFEISRTISFLCVAFLVLLIALIVKINK